MLDHAGSDTVLMCQLAICRVRNNLRELGIEGKIVLNCSPGLSQMIKVTFCRLDQCMWVTV